MLRAWAFRNAGSIVLVSSASTWFSFRVTSRSARLRSMLHVFRITGWLSAIVADSRIVGRAADPA